MEDLTDVIDLEFNPYKILGVTKESTQKQIKDAYTKLTMKLHPDKLKEKDKKNPKKLKEYENVKIAYQVLTNKEKRRFYDLGGADKLNLFLRNEKLTESIKASRPPEKTEPLRKEFKVTIRNIYDCKNMPFEYEATETKDSEDDFDDEKVTVVHKKKTYIALDSSFYFGKEVTIEDKGNQDANHLIGDLIVTIRQKDDDSIDDFTKDGLDLLYMRDMTISEATTGYCFKIKHPSGKTYWVEGLRLENMMTLFVGERIGFKDKQNKRGNLRVYLSVKLGKYNRKERNTLEDVFETIPSLAKPDIERDDKDVDLEVYEVESVREKPGKTKINDISTDFMDIAQLLFDKPEQPKKKTPFRIQKFTTTTTTTSSNGETNNINVDVGKILSEIQKDVNVGDNCKVQ